VKQSVRYARIREQARRTERLTPGWLALITAALAHVEAARRCIEFTWHPR
jgi:hypothetical protein